MLKLAAFDLDGTVADTLADLASAVNYALSRQSLDSYPVDDYRRFVGNGIDNLMKTVLGEHDSPETVQAMKADFYTYYADHSLDATKAYPGMAELLAELERRGIMTAVISNKPDAFVPRILQTLYSDHRFTLAWGQQAGIPRKPAPDALLKAMEHCGVDRGEALYIGDSNVDVQFAHNAGVKVCGVSWGFRGRRELEDAGADDIADSVQELKEMILNNG